MRNKINSYKKSSLLMLLIILFSIFGGFLIVGGEPSGEGRALEENLKNVTGDLDNLGIVEEEIYIDLGEIEDFEENISVEDFERNSTTTENNSEEDNQVINSTEDRKSVV